MFFLRQVKLTGCVGATLVAVVLSVQAGFTQTRPAPDEVHQLWAAMVDPVLRQDIKSGEQGQNFGTTMMIPLQAAFQLRDAQWEHAFADHFARLMPNFTSLPEEDLGRLQYLYVASQFMVLAKDNGQLDLIPPKLPGSIMTDILKVWEKKPAWQFDGKPFQGGVRERVLWRLETRKVPKSYYRSINDVDLFVFAIAGDIKAFTSDPAEIKAWGPVLDDIQNLAHRTFAQEVVQQPDGGWLFQPGVWTDHPEFAYAGNKEIRPGMRPIPVPGIPGDSSHALRFPLWLRSMERSYPPNSDGYSYFRQLRNGLEKQYYTKVLVLPTKEVPCYRTNNYMNGDNGVYRWEYPGLGPNRGYGPYGLSSGLLEGWWVLLDSDRIREVYRDLAATFPWPKQCIEYYLGPTPAPGTERPANAYDPNSSAMRLWHLEVLLSSRL